MMKRVESLMKHTENQMKHMENQMKHMESQMKHMEKKHRENQMKHMENQMKRRKKLTKKKKNLPKEEDTPLTKNRGIPLPPKKRKIPEVEITNKTESRSRILFYPVDNEWQDINAEMFGHQIKNVLKTGRRRHVNANSIPTVTVSMRGDGNCLFRTFSYVLFGVQSYHNDVRNKVVGFMKENKHLL